MCGSHHQLPQFKRMSCSEPDFLDQLTFVPLAHNNCRQFVELFGEKLRVATIGVCITD